MLIMHPKSRDPERLNEETTVDKKKRRLGEVKNSTNHKRHQFFDENTGTKRGFVDENGLHSSNPRTVILVLNSRCGRQTPCWYWSSLSTLPKSCAVIKPYINSYLDASGVSQLACFLTPIPPMGTNNSIFTYLWLGFNGKIWFSCRFSKNQKVPKVRWMRHGKMKSDWLFQPSWKLCSSNWRIFPQG